MTPAGQSPQAAPVPPTGGSRPPRPREPLRVQSIPVFAPVAIQLLNIVSQENVGLNKLATLIRVDPGFSVEVLRLANSPLFGARREITSILHAISMLGLNRLKSMAMTVAVRDFLAPARNAAMFAPCWRHALATAFVAGEIAGDGERDTSYTAGLIHNIGQLALIAARPADYDRMALAGQEEERELAGLEREWFGIDHTEMGLKLFEAWRLPRAFRPVFDSRAPDEGTGALVRAACAMARMMGFRAGGPDEAWDIAKLPAISLALPRTAEEVEAMVAMVATKINTLECNLVMV